MSNNVYQVNRSCVTTSKNRAFTVKYTNIHTHLTTDIIVFLATKRNNYDLVPGANLYRPKY